MLKYKLQGVQRTRKYVETEQDPLHIVAIQLNTFTPVGTAINIVAYIKNNSPFIGSPTVNIWWAQTKNERIAIEAVA